MENVDVEIETLFCSTSGPDNDDIIETLVQPIFTTENEDHGRHEWQTLGKFGILGKPKEPASDLHSLHRSENAVWLERFYCKLNYGGLEESINSSEDEETTERIVRGSDVQDLPTEYTIKGLRKYEVPVIGTYVDKSIIPGFKYLVRMLGSGRHLFGGKAQTLERIGMGYGKRLTFQGESLNHNSNYFWSDSLPEGYGFAIHVLDPGTKFDICDKKDRYVGTAMVESVDLQQKEVFCHYPSGTVEKHVNVCFTSTVEYGAEAHGLMSLRSKELVKLHGIAVVSKAKGATNAVIKSIVNIPLPYLGMCTFYCADM